MSGRTLVIGDVHGCDLALEVLLARFRLAADDTLVVLGDVVDRGPNTKRVVELLLEVRNTCELIHLMGNHEEMMLIALDTGDLMSEWLGFGGQVTVDSYGGHPEDVSQEHLAFLAAGLPYWETENAIFVHGSLEPGVALCDQSTRWLRWERVTGKEEPHPSGKRIICGHTAQKSGLPLIFPGWVCLDTLVYAGGFLSALDVETDELFQVSQQTGKLRQGCKLSDLA